MYTVARLAAGMAILHVLSVFSSTPTWILNLTIDEQYVIPPIQTNGGANAE